MPGRIVQSIILIFALACLSATCQPQSRQPLPPEPPEAITRPHIVVTRIESSPIKQPRIVGQASGVVIGHKTGRTYILTVGHIRYTGATKQGYTYGLGALLKLDGTSIDARIERFSKHGLDAIIISTKTLALPTARISETDPERREELFVLGAPLGSYRIIYRRRVRKYRNARSSRRLHYLIREFVLDGVIVCGFSGGGVYNSSKELVGMCYRRISVKNELGVCLPVSALRELINQYQ